MQSRKATPSGDSSEGDAQSQRVVRSYKRHLSSGRARLAELLGAQVEVASSGAWVTTASGCRLLNFGGYGVFFTGARHPVIVEAVRRQLDTHPLSTRVLLEPSAAFAAEALAAVTPAGLDQIYFTGSGTEATEAAIKLARAHGRARLISMHGGYHGKTMGSLSLTARALFQAPFQPLLPHVTHVPFTDLDALASAIGDAGQDAVVFVEPIQSEAGVIIPPPGYLKAVERLCRAKGALLVLDEVMTGLGRLGRWWGADREGVVPDMLLVGKTLSGGIVPCAALVASQAVFAPFSDDPFLHTSTFAASPLAMAAARATLEVIQGEDLVARAAELGSSLLEGLRSALSSADLLVREVRGVGLLLAVELADAGLAGDFILSLLQQGVIANHSLNSHSVVRFTPPATLTSSEVERFLSSVQQASRGLVDEHGGRYGR